MFSTDLLFAIKRDAYIFKETGWFCRFPKHQKLDKWAIAAEKRQTCAQTVHIETDYESQQFRKTEKWTNLGGKKKRNKRQPAYLLTQETSAIEQNCSSRDGKKEDRKEEVTEVSMKLCLVFVCQDVILWSLSMKDIN